MFRIISIGVMDAYLISLKSLISNILYYLITYKICVDTNIQYMF